ncbi:MAG: hypothetical protein HY078_04730 [Elusimicrobia bacterium]|nr:hypothetical protein [Elusimicrobiota bacterium]
MRGWPPGRVYAVLLSRLGPQGWWPVTPRGGSRPVYRPGRYARPTEGEALEIVLGAILTQNTAWTNVERALASLRAAGATTSASILRADRRRLERLIRSSGYFRQKAARLKIFLEHARRRAPTLRRWLSRPLDALRKDLLSVNGVGPETADSILLYAGGRPVFVVDAYTLRIGRRIGWFSGEGYDDAQRYLVRRLPRSVTVYQEFHALVVALAKYFCRTEPVCVGCPIREGCGHGSRS